MCTGAIDGDTGRLVRIYPITLRHNKEQFAKYQWIDARVARNPRDYRPESYRIDQESIVLGERIEPTDDWRARSEWVLREGNLYRSFDALREAEDRAHTSLGVLKPREVTRFYARRKSDEERLEWEAQREQALRQKDLWVLQQARGTCELCESRAPFMTAKRFPYLELHHPHQLAHGGPDTTENAVALCPTCHRALHFAADAEALRDALYRRVGRLVDARTRAS